MNDMRLPGNNGGGGRTIRWVRPQGVFGSTLDAKNRFMLPRVVQRDGYAGPLYLVPSVNRLTNHKILRIFNRAAWEKMRDSLPEDQKDSFVTHSQETRPDGSGRLLLPKEIMAQLEFSGTEKLVVVNQGDHLRVWRQVDYRSLPLPSF